VGRNSREGWPLYERTAARHGGRTIRGKDRIVTDGPYAESKDLVTGALLLEAASLDEATSLAQGCPVFDYGGSVEVRMVFRHEL